MSGLARLKMRLLERLSPACTPDRLLEPGAPAEYLVLEVMVIQHTRILVCVRNVRWSE